TIVNQHGMPPPQLPVQPEQLTEDDEHSDDYHAARGAEDKSEEAVHAAEDRETHVVRDDGAERRAAEQNERDDDDARRPGPHVAPREQSAEVRLDHVREMPGHEERHDPGAERYGLAEKSAHGTHDRRQHDNGDDHVIGYVHGSG